MNSPTAIAGSANRSSGTRGRRQPSRLRVTVTGGHDVRRVAGRERHPARLHARIRACTKCVDAGYLECATPIVAGSATDRIAIVGQAPGAVEVVMGKPFAGRSGAELRRWLGEAGIDEAHLPYRTAITKCFPGKAASGTGDRRPSPAEIALCAPWLEQELTLLRLHPPTILRRLGAMDDSDPTRIPAVRVGRVWRIPRREFEEWLARSSQAARQLGRQRRLF